MNLCLQGIFILEFVSCVFSQKCVDKSTAETARLVPSNKFCRIILAQKMFSTETEMETPPFRLRQQVLCLFFLDQRQTQSRRRNGLRCAATRQVTISTNRKLQNVLLPASLLGYFESTN